jgi:DNA-binding transcriptional LysR family regulator
MTHIDKPLDHDYMRDAYFCDLLSLGGLTKKHQSGAWAEELMELNQVSYFINLAKTLNFTAAARLSGVSQPSLTRAIRRLEEELGGPLIYRDGKNSRLTGLGQDVEAEFQRMVVAMKSVRNHSENWAMGRRRVLDVAVAPTVGPKEFTAFFESALAEMPSIEFRLHSLQSNEDTSEVLSGKYHACILPRETRPERKLDVRPLFRERFVLGCSANHPLAASEIVRGEDLIEFPFVDRLKCECRDQIFDHFARRDLLMQPRFRSDREDWVQRVVADGHAICILPERSATAHGLVTRPIDGFVLEREIVITTVSGSVELRKIAQLAAQYEWN